jgi:hypothetical protein
VTFIPTPFSSPSVTPAAFAGSQYRQIPYISVSEYRYAPTAVGTGQLVQGGTGTDATASAAQVIARASGMVDEYCFHRGDGTLAASVTTESNWVKVKPDGSVALICNFKPILAVVGVGLGPNPSTSASMDSTAAADITVTDKVIWLPGTWSWSGRYPTFGGYPTRNGQMWAVWQYINGYPHTQLAANATKGATSIVVTPNSPSQTIPAGVYAGTQLTIKDGTSTEVVTVASAPTSTTLQLLSPTQYAHTVPQSPDAIMVTAVPWAVEQAVISLTSVLVKAQGNRALVMGSVGQPATREAASRAGALDDYDRACGLLKPFQTVYVH